jgi:hypothetical protein
MKLTDGGFSLTSALRSLQALMWHVPLMVSEHLFSILLKLFVK